MCIRDSIEAMKHKGNARFKELVLLEGRLGLKALLRKSLLEYTASNYSLR